VIHGAGLLVADTIRQLAGVSTGALAAALLLHVGKLLAEARAWHWIVAFAHGEQPVRFRTSLGAFVAAIAVNVALPARIGEGLRVFIVRREVPGSSAVTIAGTVVLETALEIVFALAAIASVLALGGPVGLNASALGALGSPWALAALGAAAAGAILLAYRLRTRVRGLATRLVRGFSVLGSRRALFGRVLPWKLTGWTLRLACVYAFLVAFGLPASLWTVLVVVAAQSVAAAVPLLPGNAGTQQAALAVALAGSATAAGVLAFGFGMQAATSVADLLLGIGAVALVARRGDVGRALSRFRPAVARS
jgi:uncharacterized membrane protein YbhN (UPF0104 family)